MSWERQEKIIMAIDECCNLDVVCCGADTTVPEVAALMRKHHVGDVIVVENRGGLRVPIGIVTDRDIVIEITALNVDANAFTAGDLMSSPVQTVGKDDGFVDVLRAMRAHKIRRMPVVTNAGTLYGIVTADDIINLLGTELALMAGMLAEQPAREGRLRK
jgi:CBS domain-containing protein